MSDKNDAGEPPRSAWPCKAANRDDDLCCRDDHVETVHLESYVHYANENATSTKEGVEASNAAEEKGAETPAALETSTKIDSRESSRPASAEHVDFCKWDTASSKNTPEESPTGNHVPKHKLPSHPETDPIYIYFLKPEYESSFMTRLSYPDGKTKVLDVDYKPRTLSNGQFIGWDVVRDHSYGNWKAVQETSGADQLTEYDEVEMRKKYNEHVEEEKRLWETKNLWSCLPKAPDPANLDDEMLFFVPSRIPGHRLGEYVLSHRLDNPEKPAWRCRGCAILHEASEAACEVCVDYRDQKTFTSTIPFAPHVFKWDNNRNASPPPLKMSSPPDKEFNRVSVITPVHMAGLSIRQHVLRSGPRGRTVGATWRCSLCKMTYDGAEEYCRECGEVKGEKGGFF